MPWWMGNWLQSFRRGEYVGWKWRSKDWACLQPRRDILLCPHGKADRRQANQRVVVGCARWPLRARRLHGRVLEYVLEQQGMELMDTNGPNTRAEEMNQKRVLTQVRRHEPTKEGVDCWQRLEWHKKTSWTCELRWFVRRIGRTAKDSKKVGHGQKSKHFSK